MNKKNINKIKNNLLIEKEKIINKSYQHTDKIDTDGDETDEIQANLLIELTNELNSRDNEKLYNINEALKRINDKTYGLCEDCGDEIAEKRLIFNPYFLTCISCAENREMESKQQLVRPIPKLILKK